MKAKFNNRRTGHGEPQGRTARESGSTLQPLYGLACKAVTPQDRNAAGSGRRAPNAERRKMAGQTLVMAMIILGVLLVLGVVFIAIVSKNIRHTVSSQKRSVAYDLAEAGVRYAHMQMLYSLQGADWRPNPNDFSGDLKDPDYVYIRPPDPTIPGDYGGPDQRGPYSRLLFDRGRALIRVRYAPSDPTVFSSVPVGDMLQMGKARDYTIIESVGKAGPLNPLDPTQANLQSGAREVVESKKVIAFVSCGLIEQALFIDNKYHVSSPAEIGFPTNAGATYGDTGAGPQPVVVPVQMGQPTSMYEPYIPGQGNPQTDPSVFFGGSIVCNQDLIIHGILKDELNPTVGDGIFVAGSIRGADGTAQMQLSIATPNGNNALWTENTYPPLTNNSNPALNSDSPYFSTFAGALKDAFQTGDSQGYPRGMSYKTPPSMLLTDPDTGLNRYVQMTQLSGRLYGLGNAGRYGHGQGVYCNNNADIQIPTDEQGREDVGSAESLVYDWLNPGNGQAFSGWKGAFYVPRGAIVRLVNDGFIIIRDGRAPANQRTWKEPDGSTGLRPGATLGSANPADVLDSPTIRYKLVFDPANGTTYVFNSLSVQPDGTIVDINQINSGNVFNYRATGYPFNGVLYFAGNVRVRGQIPTDMQLTIVSGATIYIDGSITKGLVNNGTHPNVPVGHLIDSPSKSMLALLAKDYVAVNTTQFFGSSPLQTLSEVSDSTSAVEWNPVRVKVDDAIDFVNELNLDPNTPPANGGNPLDPRTFKPYALQYVVAGSINGFENSNLLLEHTMDNGPAPSTFINMNVNDKLGAAFANSSTGEWQYLFDLSFNNNASAYYPPGFVQPPYSVPNAEPLYGLGAQSWQRYRKFEGGAFPIVTSDFTWDPNFQLINGANTSPSGLYHLLVGDLNNFAIGVKDTPGGSAVNDYIVARAAIVPQDIRIEATIFAEEGSFFVIPGPWFNPNPDDRRDNYVNLGNTNQERDLKRKEDFGSTPNMPFYGEPLDVRIQILGAVTENLTPPIGQQAEWLKKWGWIPRYHGASGELIPQQHVPAGFNVSTTDQYVPNISIAYDPVLATGRNVGFVGAAGPVVDQATMIRYQSININPNPNGPRIWFYYALPPLPRLPVSPTLAYFGEVNP